MCRPKLKFTPACMAGAYPTCRGRTECRYTTWRTRSAPGVCSSLPTRWRWADGYQASRRELERCRPDETAGISVAVAAGLVPIGAKLKRGEVRLPGCRLT